MVNIKGGRIVQCYNDFVLGQTCEGHVLVWGKSIVSNETAGNEKMPEVYIVGLRLTVILVFALSTVISYQGMTQVGVYENPGPMSYGVCQINIGLFWIGRILGTLGSLSVWFLLLRKGFVQKTSGKTIVPYVSEIISNVLVFMISWFASAMAAFLCTGFVDIQPRWADNAYIVNIPVCIFAIITIADIIFIGIRRAIRKEGA